MLCSFTFQCLCPLCPPNSECPLPYQGFGKPLFIHLTSSLLAFFYWSHPGTGCVLVHLAYIPVRALAHRTLFSTRYWALGLFKIHLIPSMGLTYDKRLINEEWRKKRRKGGGDLISLDQFAFYVEFIGIWVSWIKYLLPWIYC